MSEVDYDDVLTLLEQADRACSGHNTQLARQHLAALKLLMYKLKEDELKIVPAENVA